MPCVPDSTPLSSPPSSTSASTVPSTRSGKRPLPKPAGPPAVDTVMNRVSTAPDIPRHRATGTYPLPRLHHVASQPDLATNRHTYYGPQTDLYAYSGAVRTTPSIPNLRTPLDLLSSMSSSQDRHTSPANTQEFEGLTRQTSVSGTENISHRPLPKPQKARSPALVFRPEPPERQAIPSSAPSLRTGRVSGWEGGAACETQTAVSRAMDRSDTLTSVKSLDRWDFSQITKQKTTADGRNRPLPSTPGHAQTRGLAPSRSLDRGTPRDGTLPPKILAATSANENTMPNDPESFGRSGRSSMMAPTSTAPFSRTKNTQPLSLSPGQPANVGTSNALETLHNQVTDVMAVIRIDDTLVEENTAYKDTVTSRTTDAGRTQSEPKTKQIDNENSTQVAAISQAGIPTIVFPDAEESSEMIPIPAAQTSSPGLSAGYASAPPAITMTITTEDAETMPVPAIVVSKEGAPQRNETRGILPKKGVTESHVDANPQSKAGTVTGSTSSVPASCGIFCHACDLVILGSIVNAMEKGWHPACFNCTTCRMPLEHVSSFEHEGKPYCHMDYHEVCLFESEGVLGLHH